MTILLSCACAFSAGAAQQEGGAPAQKAGEKTVPSADSSAGKRDPFRPLALREPPVRRSRENLSPLERYELGQLKLVGIVWDVREPVAMVEDSAGLGYAVKVGTPIGQNDGKITAIQSSQIIIEEIHTDFYGARKSRVVSMKLSSE